MASVQPLSAEPRHGRQQASACRQQQPAGDQSEASVIATRRVARQLNSSSTAATVQVAPRWIGQAHQRGAAGDEASAEQDRRRSPGVRSRLRSGRPLQSTQGAALDHSSAVGVPRLAAAYAGGVKSMSFVWSSPSSRGAQVRHVHRGAAPRRELCMRGAAVRRRQLLRQFADHVAQAVGSGFWRAMAQ